MTRLRLRIQLKWPLLQNEPKFANDVAGARKRSRVDNDQKPSASIINGGEWCRVRIDAAGAEWRLLELIPPTWEGGSSAYLEALKCKPRGAIDRKHAMASKHATESLAYCL
jgi:hypothetical protein